MQEIQCHPPIVEEPHQPVAFNFLKKEYGKQIVIKPVSLVREVDVAIHYHVSNDCVVCHTRVKAFKELKMRAKLKVRKTCL